MKSTRVPAALLAALCVGFLLYVADSASLLPERVATHFGVNGQPNGWMSRSGYLRFTGIMSVALPLFIVALCFVSRFLPAAAVNIPHREYWLAPERCGQTQAYIFRHCLWLACLVVCFMGALHYATIRANDSFPVRWPWGLFLVILAGFLGALAVWILTLVRHFAKPS